MRTPIQRVARWLVPAAASLSLFGCNQATIPDPGDPGLTRFSSCGELRDYSADVMLEALVDARYGWGIMFEDAATDSDSGGGESPSDYTTTNVQEEGVDEIDIVKTDGNHIYVAQDRAFHIVKSWPVEASEKLATLELDGWIRGMFLKGDKAVVFHSVQPDAERYYGARATVIDISDRAAPVIEREIDVEGWMADGRMIEDDVYFVVNHYLDIPEAAWELLDGRIELPEIDWDLEGAALEKDIEDKKAIARSALRSRVHDIADDMLLTDFLPEWRDQVAGAAAADFELMHDCSDLYRPSGVGHHGAVSIVNLDLEDDSLNASGLLTSGWQLYASKDNLYVAQNSRWWWWGGFDRELVTHIHKFNLGTDGEPAYVASGEVDGWAYDQFAFSEHDGYLRVATSEQDWWWGWWDEEREDPSNNLYVLEDDGAGTLDIVGHVDDIAPNERIYATRFFGNTAYMVTFEQIDPLFTFDLSDPEKPEIVGELKIPGFSSYLHPMGDDHLLAVGRAGDEDGNVGGLAFSVFDVSDLENPAQVQSFTVEGSDWSWSEALWDHHAFTYHRDVLTVPMYTWYSGSGPDRWFSGAISLSATPDGLSEIGRVDHRPLVDDSECLWSRWYDWEDSVCAGDYWYANVRRSIYIEDNLFTLSNYGLRVTDLNDPSIEHARVVFYPER